MIELAKYLHRVCGLDTLIDELGIPESVTKVSLLIVNLLFSLISYRIILNEPCPP